jgi:hypothetical protein
MNYLKSLRDYLDARAAIGELVTVEREVDWNLEIGAIIRRCYETGAPAALFQRIKGIEPGFRVLGAPAGTSRQPGQYLARARSQRRWRRDCRGAGRRTGPRTDPATPYRDGSLQRECPAGRRRRPDAFADAAHP